MIYKNLKKGQQGIGTLVIFIALILVAAVAAGVLIQTASSLQGKATNTGSQVQQRLATGFSIIEVIANDTSDSVINGSTTVHDTISTTVRLAPGSEPVKLSDITLSIVTKNGKASYTGSQFTHTAIKGSDSDGYINNDDVITFGFNLDQRVGDIPESSDFTIRIYPGVGQPIPVALVTPASMTDKYTVLK